MIYLLSNGPGRFGNRLFAANFIFQLKEIYGEDIYVGGMNDLKNYFVFTFQNNFRYNFKKVKIINKSFPISSKTNYLIKPPILGNHYFNYNVDINNYLKIKSIYKSKRIDLTKDNVAVHFRGTDFSQWNPKSILKTSYYINSIEQILKLKRSTIFYLYTDDKELESYKEVLKFLRKGSYEYFENDLSLDFMYDFYEISQCKTLISSPSTFSIMAGIFGVEKKIYHSKEWVNHRIKANDKFWIDLDNFRTFNNNEVFII